VDDESSADAPAQLTTIRRPTMRPSILSRLCLDARTALLAAAVAAPLAPAQAQLGKLVKRGVQGAIEGAVDRKAREAAGVPPAEGSATSSSSSSTASSSKAASKLEITGAHLDAFLVAMAEPVTVARENIAARAALVEHRKRFEAQGACHVAVVSRGAPDYTPAQQARIDEVQKRQGAMADRLGALTDKLMANPSDPALRRQADALSDSARTLGAELQDAFYPTLAKECGARVSEPPAKVEDRRIPGARLPEGMTPRQFGLMRERVGAWLLNNGIAAALSDAERAALESRRAQLAPLADLFRTQIYWVSWSDDEFRS
jgi:hypothetical protein